MKKRGDMMDLLLRNERIIHTKNKPSVIYDYPETVIKILDKFISIWK